MGACGTFYTFPSTSHHQDCTWMMYATNQFRDKYMAHFFSHVSPSWLSVKILEGLKRTKVQSRPFLCQDSAEENNIRHEC